jgi:hypothetical protein
VSDYLSGVVARALNLEPVVRPVTPSIFESAAASGFVETVIAPEARPAPAKQLEQVEPVKHRSILPAPPRVDAVAHAKPERRVESETVREPRIETSVIPPAADVTELRREVVEHATVIERHTRELRETELRELVVETVSPPGAPVKLQAAEPKSASAPIAPRAVVPTAIHPPVRPAARQPIEEPADEQPTVRVTIGRVEVRAVFPASAPALQPKSRTAQVMPLEEYLKQGNRRAR